MHTLVGSWYFSWLIVFGKPCGSSTPGRAGCLEGAAGRGAHRNPTVFRRFLGSAGDWVKPEECARV